MRGSMGILFPSSALTAAITEAIRSSASGSFAALTTESGRTSPYNEIVMPGLEVPVIAPVEIPAPILEQVLPALGFMDFAAPDPLYAPTPENPYGFGYNPDRPQIEILPTMITPSIQVLEIPLGQNIPAIISLPVISSEGMAMDVITPVIELPGPEGVQNVAISIPEGSQIDAAAFGTFANWTPVQKWVAVGVAGVAGVSLLNYLSKKRRG